MDDGPAAIADDAERAAVRRQARKVHVQALVAAAALTVAALLAPGP